MRQSESSWISRYIDAYLVVTRRIDAHIRETIGPVLTGEQFLILRLIDRQRNCTSTYLSEAFAVGKSSITAIVNRLVEAGLVDRTRDGNDRRQIYLSLTASGTELYHAVEAEIEETVSPYFVHFEQADIEKFIAMFEQLAALMKETGGRKE